MIRLHSVKTPVCDVSIGHSNVSAEVWATVAAMFSRSVDGIEAIAEKVNDTKAEKFMESTYVGYGHASIGDLADIHVFVEGVPFYVACMLEHHSRFKGQESSTRYINFAKQRPAYDADVETYNEQIATYLTAVEKVQINLVANLPSSVPDGVDSAQATRAIKARAFDICRSLLPWGATTNVAWYGDIRSITAHLAWLVSDKNPNRNVTNIAPYVDVIYKAISDVYPHSTKLLANTRPSNPWPYPRNGEDMIYLASTNDEQALDFGSWRDLNRHRVGFHDINFERATNMHPWYKQMLNAHEVEYEWLDFPKPSINKRLLGQLVPYAYGAHEDQMEYVAHLRSKTTVHPTLRGVIQNAAQFHGLEYDIAPDVGPMGFYLHRGNDTILFKGKEL